MDDLSELTSNELRKRLQDAGLPSGPITKTTRKTFESKLAKYLREKEGPKIEDEQNEAGDCDSKTGIAKENTGNKKEDTSDGGQQETPAATKPTASKSGNFFGICIALDSDNPDSPASVHVYEDRSEAMKVVKMNPGARFKAFKTKEEARKFSSSSQEMTPCTPLLPSQIPSEKSNNYKTPKTIDLVRLMKAIEQNDMASFRQFVWSNPRYLISSADTPVILMGGPRYNALHVAAKHNVAAMCREILNILENDKFLSLVFANDSPAAREERSSFIIDLYLNTPDKGQCDTPLHFASKFGHIDVVEVLIQHPMCDRGIRNKYGSTPRNVICERCDDSKLKLLKQTWSRDIENIKTLKTKIESLLEDNFYVPVFRSEGNSMQAVIGEPWSPDFGDKVSVHVQRHASPISPSLQVKAFAGPMSPQKAQNFHYSWTSPSKSCRQIKEIRRSDDEKGLERIGRNLAQTMAVPWSEYWGFLGKFADFSTDEGLQLLEDYLKNRSLQMSRDNDDLLVKNFAALSLDDKVEEDSEKVVNAQKYVDADGDSRSVVSGDTGQNITPTKTKDHLKHVNSSTTENVENSRQPITPNKVENDSQSKTTPSSSKLQRQIPRNQKSLFQQSQDNMLQKNTEIETNEYNLKTNLRRNEQDSTNVIKNATKKYHSEEFENLITQVEDLSIIEGSRDMMSEDTDSIESRPFKREQPKESNASNIESGELSNDSTIGNDISKHIESSIEFKDKLNVSSGNLSTAKSSSSVEVLPQGKLPIDVRQSQSTPLKNGQNSTHSKEPSTLSENLSTPESNISNDKVIRTHEGSINKTLPQQSRSAVKFELSGADLSTPKRRLSSCSFVFIQGFEPSKLDMNVYLALESVHIPSTYPHIVNFKQLIEGYSLSDRKSWKTPIRSKRDRRLLQDSVSSPVMGSKILNISPHSLSPTFNRTMEISVNRSSGHDIKGKLFVS